MKIFFSSDLDEIEISPEDLQVEIDDSESVVIQRSLGSERSSESGFIGGISASMSGQMQDLANSISSMMSVIIPLILGIIGGILLIDIGIRLFVDIVAGRASASVGAAPAIHELEDNWDDIVENYGVGSEDIYAYLDEGEDDD